MRYNLVQSAVSAAVLVLLIWGFQAHAQTTDSPKTVPDFSLNDLDGNTVVLSSLRGNVVLINFWATWCPPCVEELPTMQALKDHFVDQPFEVLAINMAEDKPDIESFFDRINLQLDFPLLLDPGGVTADQYEVQSLPATLIVDQSGQFVFGGVGARDWNSKAVHEEIEPLFN